MRPRSPSRFLKDAFSCLLPAESQEQGFLGRLAQRVVYWTSSFNRCSEAGHGRMREVQRGRSIGITPSQVKFSTISPMAAK